MINCLLSKALQGGPHSTQVAIALRTQWPRVKFSASSLQRKNIIRFAYAMSAKKKLNSRSNPSSTCKWQDGTAKKEIILIIGAH